MSFYRSLLGIRSVRAVSETELHLEYDVPQGPIVLVMKLDELTKRLADAAVSFAILASLCYEGHKLTVIVPYSSLEVISTLPKLSGSQREAMTCQG